MVCEAFRKCVTRFWTFCSHEFFASLWPLLVYQTIMKTDGVGHFRKLVGWLFERCNNMIVSCVKNERKWGELEGGRDWEL